MELEHEIIIVPDIHGRAFWRDTLPYIQNGTPVIFLGDYLDPYPHEGISPDQALDNFKDILKETEGRDNVTLLLGNHDMTYVAPEADICECRTDYEHLEELHQLFMHNADRFKFIHQVRRDMATPSVTFSHAGIHPGWFKRFWPGIQANIMQDSLQQLMVDQDWWHKFCQDLAVVSRERGGWGKYGSCVWADIREFEWANELWPGLQIVGHSQQLNYGYNEQGKLWWKPGQPVRMQNVVCLDCHQCFYLDSEGDIRFLKDDKAIV